MKMMQCTGCNEWLEDNDENFYYHKSGKRIGKRVSNKCKKCRAIYKKQYDEQHKEEKKAYVTKYNAEHKEEAQKYRDEHKEGAKEYFKQYTLKHKGEKKEYDKKYYIENKEKRNTYHKQYRGEHKEELKIKAKQYKEEHKEEIRQKQKQFRENNKEKIREQKRKEMIKNPEKFLEFIGRRHQAWRLTILKNFDYTCQKCGFCSLGGKGLNSHHIFPKADFYELRYDINNGVCLCSECHREFHKKYGYHKYFDNIDEENDIIVKISKDLNISVKRVNKIMKNIEKKS